MVIQSRRSGIDRYRASPVVVPLRSMIAFLQRLAWPGLFFLLTACAHVPVADSLADAPPLTGWTEDFDAPRLGALVEEALSNHPSIKASLARVSAARARLRVSGAALLPGVDLGASAGRSRTNSRGREVTISRFALTGEVSWEADLWGRLRQREAAALGEARAARADLAAARLLLAGQVAKAWFAAVEASSQAALAEREVENFAATLKIIRRRYEAGIGDALDVRLASGNLDSARANAALRRQRVDATRRALEQLLGRYPEGALHPAGGLPGLSAAVPADLSVELVHRRPDVRASLARLRAALHRSEDAARNYLPAIRLTGNGGVASAALKDLLDVDSLIWSITASLTQPLFHGDRLRAERTLAQAGVSEALYNYADRLMRAFQEVETALAAEPMLRERVAHFEQAAADLEAAERLALSRYQAGLATITSLLDTRRRAFNFRANLLASKLNLLNNRVDLYLALGGGYR